MANFQGDTVNILGIDLPVPGGTADDMVNARTNGNDTVNGGQKNDKIYISKGNDTYNGGLGTDTLSARFFDESVTADLTAGTVKTGHGHESTAINFENYQGAADGNYVDNVRGSEGNNTISTYGGDDAVTVTRGNDTYNAGEGVDVLNLGWAPSAGVNEATGAFFNMETGDLIWTEEGTTHVSKANDFETYLGLGTNATDTVIGNDSDNIIQTYSGNDQVYLSRGNDTIDGGNGDEDLINAGIVGDTWVNANLETGVIRTGHGDEHSAINFENYSGKWLHGKSDYVTGSSAKNVIKTHSGQDIVFVSKGADKLDAGSSFDWLNASDSTAEGVSDATMAAFNMEFGTYSWTDGAQSHVQEAKNFEGYRGIEGSDIVVGSDERNIIFTHGGDDIVSAAGGNDDIDAGLGTNRVSGGDGDSDLVYLNNHEFVDTRKEAGANNIWLDFKSNIDGKITTVQKSTENISLNNQATTWDEVWASHRVDVIDPDLKNKKQTDLTGSYLNEDFFGGKGRDNLTGHGGADYFHYDRKGKHFTNKKADHILDFDATEGDKIVLDVSRFSKKLDAADASLLIIGQGDNLKAALKTDNDFIYHNDGVSGSLYFNKNGAKADKKVGRLMFAELTDNSDLNLAAEDVMFV